MVTFENPITRQQVLQHTVANEYLDIVRKAATNGQLRPRSSATLLPLPAATGELFLDCFIPLDEFRVFASQFEVGVKFAPEFTQSPRPLAVDPTLLALKPTDRVIVHSVIGSFSGKSWVPAKDYIEVLEQIIARQKDGFFTVGEAAQVLADSRSGIDVKDMIRRIGAAMVIGHRLARNPDRLPLLAEHNFREYLDLVKVSDIDLWLTDLGTGYCFPQDKLGAPSLTSTVIKTASDGDELWKEKARARAYEIIKRDKGKDLYPSQVDIADEIAKQFRKDGLTGADGKPLAGAYIKRHALNGISSAQSKLVSTVMRQSK